MQALSIGIGHLQEEVLNQHRQRAYERLATNTNSYQSALELHKLERLPTGGAVTRSAGIAPLWGSSRLRCTREHTVGRNHFWTTG